GSGAGQHVDGAGPLAVRALAPPVDREPAPHVRVKPRKLVPEVRHAVVKDITGALHLIHPNLDALQRVSDRLIETARQVLDVIAQLSPGSLQVGRGAL